MSYGNKDNGREYMSRNNQNSKMQSMNNRNINSSQQYSNSNSGDNYSYDMKNQRACGSPKQSNEMHNNNQQGTNSRENYQYKNDNSRYRMYSQKYNNDRSNYYNQQSNTQNDVIIPGIHQLKEFIAEQSELFKMELNKHEDRKSCSPSPRGNFHPDFSQQRNQGRPTGANRGPIGMTTSNSLGTIASSNNFSTVSSMATAAASINNNFYSNKPNYNKTVQSSGGGKPNNLLSRNLSHEETSYSKLQQNNKNRISSPNATGLEKSPNSKSQFQSSSHVVATNRQDNNKSSDINNKVGNKSSSSYSFVPGINSQQQNTNSPMLTAITYESRKANSQQNRPSTATTTATTSTGVGPGPTGGGGGSGTVVVVNPARMNGDSEPTMKPGRVDVSIGEVGRTFSNSGNTTDSQEIEFCTPDSPTSPCSLRSLQIDDGRQNLGQRPSKKPM